MGVTPNINIITSGQDYGRAHSAYIARAARNRIHKAAPRSQAIVPWQAAGVQEPIGLAEPDSKGTILECAGPISTSYN